MLSSLDLSRGGAFRSSRFICLLKIGNLGLKGLCDGFFEFFHLASVHQLSRIEVGDGFQGGLGLFRVDALELLELGGQGVDFFAPPGGFPVDGGNFVHEVGDVIRNLRAVVGNPDGEAVFQDHMAVFVELEFHGILLGSGYGFTPGYSLASRHDRRAGPHNWA